MKRFVCFIILLSLLTSCENKHDVGQYFYVGYGNLYHIDQACNSGASNKAKGKVLVNAHDTYANAFKNGNQWWVHESLSSQPIYFCSKCISNTQMMQIEDSIEKCHNMETASKNDSVVVSRKWLYKNLRMNGYNVGNTYEDFAKLMDTNEQSRKWAYDRARELGYNVGKTYDQFKKLIGVGQNTWPQNKKR